MPCAVLPMRNDLSGGRAVSHLAGFAGLTVRHVIEDVLHGSAVRQVALADLSIGLLSAMALVSMQ